MHNLKHQSTSLLIFPTKALAQDQKRSFDAFLSCCNLNIQIKTFDGDTPHANRNQCQTASILFTNPDILHCSLLPQHFHWRSFLQKLKYIVVDEMHYWKGTLGAHITLLMMRMKRILWTYGNTTGIFIALSATLSNPFNVRMNNTSSSFMTHMIHIRSLKDYWERRVS